MTTPTPAPTGPGTAYLDYLVGYIEGRPWEQADQPALLSFEEWKQQQEGR